MRTIGIYLTLAFLVCFEIAFSAPAPPTGGGPACWPPPCTPIDGGIAFLAVAGAAYGAKKLFFTKKKA
jgi:hypothetical protein